MISPQQEICPSSLTSRACLSHRARPSTFSLVAFVQGDPPNKWLISHGDPFSEVCPCGLFSLMRSAPLFAHRTRYLSFRGAEPLGSGDSKKRPHTHDANRYQAT